MKNKILLFVAIASVMSIHPVGGQEPGVISATSEGRHQEIVTRRDSVSYLLGINFGSIIKRNDFGEMDYDLIVQGIKAFMDAKGNMRDSNFVKQFAVNPEEMDRIVDSYLEERHAEVLAKNKSKEEAFFAANLKKPGVKATRSGLQYVIREKGNMMKVPAGKDETLVFYTGRLIDGTVFDSHTEKDGDPVKFALKMIPGWNEGIRLIGEGGRITLYIPSELAYGEKGVPLSGIGPCTPLVFEIDLLQVIRHND